MATEPGRHVLSEAERGVLGFFSARAGEILEFARDLIRIPSPNPPGDERAVADAVTDRR